MTTHILGISAFYHDSAAALLTDGQIVAAVAEERFTRTKHDPAFPAQAIAYCLDEGSLTLADLDAVIFYDKPLPKFERLLETYMAHAPRGFGSFLRSMPVWLKEKLYLKSLLKRELAALAQGSGDAKDLPPLLFAEHHQSHAAAAFYPSPFAEAAVLCLDGVGEWATTSIWHGAGNRLQPLAEIQFPHSLGLLYSAFTQYCGFRVNSGEYKLMGLAPYGEPRFRDTILEHLIDLRADGSFALNLAYFDYPVGKRMVNARFEALFGAPSLAPDAAPQQMHMDMAASIQAVTEVVVLHVAAHAKALTGCRHLCLAGGVALNCVANGRLLKEGPFEDLWIQPAAGDAGGALGAAYLAWHEHFHNARPVPEADAMRGAQLGPSFTDEDIASHLQVSDCPHTTLDDKALYAHVAGLLDEGAVVGWFQGAAEFGPRALGNRSILGDARSTTMQRVMNEKIKQRESFRPFAPAVLAEDAAAYFDLDCPSPYMLLVSQVRDELRCAVPAGSRGIERLAHAHSTLPAITHVDFSARLQTVDAASQPRFYRLLAAFRERTGCSVLINTSFNVRGEPPVLTPADAVRCFLATDMDYLVLGNHLLDKRQQTAAGIAAARERTFAPD